MAIDHHVLDDMPAEPLDRIAPKIQNGDILLCSATDPFSRLISWSTKSPWTHVGFAWRWPDGGRILALECVQKMGVHAVPIDRFISQTSDGQSPYPGKILLARHAQVSEGANLAALIKCGIDHMGDRFSPAEIAKIGMRIIAGRWDRKTPRPLRAKDEMICSEYVDKCFKAGGVNIPWDGLGFIAPCDVAADPRVSAVARFRTG
ncbi:MAG TPA: hypothetical protein VGH03_21575 [Caulobacteraceae bacterium]|jgi:hypothetical protein